MKPFDPCTPCAKCGYTIASAKFHYEPLLPYAESMKRECLRCGWRWVEAPLDAKVPS